MYNYWHHGVARRPGYQDATAINDADLDDAFDRVDTDKLRELRLVGHHFAKAYLSSLGITAEYERANAPAGHLMPLDTLRANVERYATNDDDAAWYLTREAWSKCCESYDARAMAQSLRDIGALRAQQNRFTVRGGPTRFNGAPAPHSCTQSVLQDVPTTP